MRPHVCMVTTVHPADDHRIFHKEAKTLAQAGYHVTVLAQGAQAGNVDGVYFESLPPRLPRIWQRVPRLFGVWRRARALHADVYHLHDPELIPLGLLLKAEGYRVVYDIHEHVPLQIEYGKLGIPWPWARKRVARLYDFAERFSAARFDGIITVVEAIAERFSRLRRVAIVRNVPTLEQWMPAAPAAGSEVIAIYVGTLTRPRGVLEAVQGVSRLDPALNVHLRVVGSFPHPEYEAEVRAAANDRVHFLGRVPHDAVPGLLAESHIGMATLYPIDNYQHAWPVKLFEYMAAGLPVVMSAIPLWEQLADGCALAVDPHDPDTIAQAVATLARDPARRVEMGQRGRALVNQHYSWDAQARILLDLYARIVGPPHPSPAVSTTHESRT